ncbi:MAG: hypothetical protein WC460_06465 [Patescibacteria group bacterium]
MEDLLALAELFHLEVNRAKTTDNWIIVRGVNDGINIVIEKKLNARTNKHEFYASREIKGVPTVFSPSVGLLKILI